MTKEFSLSTLEKTAKEYSKISRQLQIDLEEHIKFLELGITDFLNDQEKEWLNKVINLYQNDLTIAKFQENDALQEIFCLIEKIHFRHIVASYEREILETTDIKKKKEIEQNLLKFKKMQEEKND